VSDFLNQWMGASEGNKRLVAQETLILETTEALWSALEAAGITKSELAERMGTTKGYVSQVLSGARNMTLRTLSDICFALRASPRLAIERQDPQWTTEEGATVRVNSRPNLRLVVDNDRKAA
jgi:transcriptional regulator with XRE-family HTH domain